MAKLENNIRPDRKICARIAGWCAAAGSASLVVYFAGGQDSGGMPTFLLIAVIALTLALIFGVAALATVGQARSAQRHLEAFAAGNHLIHWTKYSPAEIRAFVAEARDRFFAEAAPPASVIVRLDAAGQVVTRYPFSGHVAAGSLTWMDNG
ncbi:MAG: hypothetical protein ACREOH_14300, partial [Candidatus Entotheonellia bacterium]